MYLSIPDVFLVLRYLRVKFTSMEVTYLAEGKSIVRTQMMFHRHIVFNFGYARMIFVLFDNVM